MSEPLSDLAIQLRLSAIYQELTSLRQQVESERLEPEDGPLVAYLKFGEKSMRSAAETLNPTLVRASESRSALRIMPERKRWSLFGN
jgi:hypothetical protein